MENKIVFLLGVFDMIHVGHFKLIERASKLGNHLVIGIVCDEAVQRQKGINRPIISQEDRQYIVSKIEGVKQTCLLHDFYIPQSFIKTADIIVVGEDQQHIKNIADIPDEKRYNMPRTEGVSTSDIIKKIKGEK